jgi:cyclophilin family peptidyl-prolyl cis-trans isomerase/HEAT repeat protein
MKRKFYFAAALLAFFVSSPIFAQISLTTMLKIVRAEDERRFDNELQELLKSPDAKVRIRAALAAGRIGNDAAIEPLAEILDKDASAQAREMAAFALGEIESARGADAILKALGKSNESETTRARLLEAAGKIAAANPKNAKSADLGEVILDALEAENAKPNRNREIVLLGIAAAMRSKPPETDFVVAKFLIDKDARVRADALNCLVRLRAVSENLKSSYRTILLADEDPIARANAARALGMSADATAQNLLTEAAVGDEDRRVRVSAIRALAALKDTDSKDAAPKDRKLAAPLLERAETLFADYRKTKIKFQNPPEKNELLEIIAVLGKLLPNSNDERAILFLQNFREADAFSSPETEIAFARIAPEKYLTAKPAGNLSLPREAGKNANAGASFAQGFGAIADVADKEHLKNLAIKNLQLAISVLSGASENNSALKSNAAVVLPELLRAYAKFKKEDLAEILRKQLKNNDVIVRATAIELLSELPPEQIRFDDFETSYRAAMQDFQMNDAILATIEAVGKQKTERATDFLKNIFYTYPDYVTKRKIAYLLKERNAADFSDKIGIPKSIFSSNDYLRAVKRRSHAVKAVVTTEKGVFAIDLLPEDAPLTVENFVRLARRGFFNNVTFHRVVPNFVVQGGDPRGDGNGGPGYSIRCEINLELYERGAVGMALSGKDTGGSQWFVTHSPQPHLDGGYTVFGRITEADMKIVDDLARGDKILKIEIIENKPSQKARTSRTIF